MAMTDNQDYTQYLYGSRYDDNYMLHTARNLPRFGNLARKVLMHYGKDQYHPHTFCGLTEIMVREVIQQFITRKIMLRHDSYNWSFIDAYFRHILKRHFDTQCPHDEDWFYAAAPTEFLIFPQDHLKRPN